jgi:predicted DNA-binding ribbon-helix-helix protein
MSSRPIHVLVLGDRRTSVRLEPVMWEALQEIAADRGYSIHELVTIIDRERSIQNLTAAIRSYIVRYYRDKFTETDSPFRYARMGSP